MNLLYQSYFDWIWDYTHDGLHVQDAYQIYKDVPWGMEQVIHWKHESEYDQYKKWRSPPLGLCYSCIGTFSSTKNWRKNNIQTDTYI